MKWKINYQDAYYGGNLGYPIETILAIVDQVNPLLPTKFQVH